MKRKSKKYPEYQGAWLPAGTLARIDALSPDRSDFIRAAIANELMRCENKPVSERELRVNRTDEIRKDQ